MIPRYNRLTIRLGRIIPVVHILLIFLYLIMYIAQVYNMSFFRKDIRMYIMILLVVFIFVRFVLRIRRKQKRNRVVFAIWLYLLVSFFLMVLHGSITKANLINELFVPIVFLSSYYAFEYITIEKEAFKCIRLEFFVLLCFFLLFIYATYKLARTYGLYINSSYYSALMLPFALLQKNRKTKLIGVVLVIIPSILVAKRGAFLALAVSAYVYYVIKNDYFSNKKNSTGKKIWRIAALIIIIGLIYYALVLLDSNIIARMRSIIDDGGSGRTEILRIIFQKIKNNSITEHLIGHGAYTSSTIVGLSAHNDFVEIYWSYGILGFCAYILVFYQLCYVALRMKKDNFFRAAYISSIVLFFVCSMVTQLMFVPSYVACLCMFWGFVLASKDLIIYERGE